MASKQTQNNQQRDESKSLVEEADALHRVIAKLSVIGDFIKRMGDDSPLLEVDTPLGLYLIMEDCIGALKRLERLPRLYD